MKELVKQQCRQIKCRRSLRNEKKSIKLLREKNQIDNFHSTIENSDMYNRLKSLMDSAEELEKSKRAEKKLQFNLTQFKNSFYNEFSSMLTSNERRSYMASRKYIAYAKYQKLLEIQDEIEILKNKLEFVNNVQQYDILYKKYKKSIGEYNTLRSELLSNEDDRKFYGLFNNINRIIQHGDSS